jgi:hypothetical protein
MEANAGTRVPRRANGGGGRFVLARRFLRRFAPMEKRLTQVQVAERLLAGSLGL